MSDRPYQRFNDKSTLRPRPSPTNPVPSSSTAPPSNYSCAPSRAEVAAQCIGDSERDCGQNRQPRRRATGIGLGRISSATNLVPSSSTAPPYSYSTIPYHPSIAAQNIRDFEQAFGQNIQRRQRAKGIGLGRSKKRKSTELLPVATPHCTSANSIALPLRSRTSSDAKTSEIPRTAEDTTNSDPVSQGSVDGSNNSSTPSSEEETGDEEHELPSKERRKRVIIDRLMNYFYETLSTNPFLQDSTSKPSNNHAIQPSRAANDSSSGSNSSTEKIANSSEPPSGDQTQGCRHKRPLREGQGDDDDKQEGGRSPKQPRGDGSRMKIYPPPARNLACPYFQRNPKESHLSRSCHGPGWPSIHRLKGHLYRCHTRPLCCPRCFKIFDADQSRDEHMRANVLCEVKSEGEPLKGFGPTQEKLLRRRKNAHNGMTEEEQWVEIYLILFPDSQRENVPSAYYGDSELCRYGEFLRRELPSRIRQKLEERIDEVLNPIEETLRTQLVDIAQDLQLELFNSYESSRANENTSALVTDSEPGPSTQSTQGQSAVVEQVPEALAVLNETATSSGIQAPAEAPRPDFWDLNLTIEEQLELLRPIPPYDGEELGDFNGFLSDLNQQSNMNDPSSTDL